MKIFFQVFKYFSIKLLNNYNTPKAPLLCRRGAIDNFITLVEFLLYYLLKIHQ